MGLDDHQLRAKYIHHNLCGARLPDISAHPCCCPATVSQLPRSDCIFAARISATKCGIAARTAPGRRTRNSNAQTSLENAPVLPSLLPATVNLRFLQCRVGLGPIAKVRRRQRHAGIGRLGIDQSVDSLGPGRARARREPRRDLRRFPQVPCMSGKRDEQRQRHAEKAHGCASGDTQKHHFFLHLPATSGAAGPILPDSSDGVFSRPFVAAFCIVGPHRLR